MYIVGDLEAGSLVVYSFDKGRNKFYLRRKLKVWVFLTKLVLYGLVVL